MFEILLLECLPGAQPCSSVSCEQNAYYAAKKFFSILELIKTELAIVEGS
jgi:hypothetical protein